MKLLLSFLFLAGSVVAQPSFPALHVVVTEVTTGDSVAAYRHGETYQVQGIAYGGAQYPLTGVHGTVVQRFYNIYGETIETVVLVENTQHWIGWFTPTINLGYEYYTSTITCELYWKHPDDDPNTPDRVSRVTKEVIYD